MNTTTVTPMSGFRLRACAAEFGAASPPAPSVISAIACVDVRTPSNRTHWAGPHAHIVKGTSILETPIGGTADLAALPNQPAPAGTFVRGLDNGKFYTLTGAGPAYVLHRARVGDGEPNSPQREVLG